ncbi:cardiolipin synthase [Pseudooceanicola sp. HF7]|uniref:cardiolipin synthase n=1 Tax=Pseudooceanicola sp. HF7 TaxID=2721560 RepID=UPI00143048B1|nr:cardiolipin synthase [Pseudooceanicola sp. HF7]NIZ08392.1 cardiolipin synthase [Pseudooceanicola sp. HF7]
MEEFSYWPLLAVLYTLAQLGFLLRALTRPGRAPSSRLAWLLVMLAAPGVGMLGYLFFGETNIGRKRAARYKGIQDYVRLGAQRQAEVVEAGAHHASEEVRHLFSYVESVCGFLPVRGNTAELLADSEAVIDAMVADIDAAQDHVHMLFYIWLDDGSGIRVADAVIRAAKRGVTVRAMADDIGSRRMIRSDHWKRMGAAGVKLTRALPITNPLLQPVRGRIDLRNHRKIVVIDNRITYCGSQNCADAAFEVKKKYAPWVDLVVRFEGPIAIENQALFISDWMAHRREDLRPILDAARPPHPTGGVLAQVIGTGPTIHAEAMPEMFELMIHAAREELVLTTPYYVPTEAMQSAICITARRGVNCTLVVPARNDSWIVAAASRSYYEDLLNAGVKIYEYPHGLLHAKSLTLDGHAALIGSANLDRRSFELNYENNILLEDVALTTALRERQQSYIDASLAVDPAQVAQWHFGRRLWYNTVAMLGPVF